MRRRFFVDEVRSGKAEITGDDARHLTLVLRVEPGQRYEISDNRNVYLAEVEAARKEHVLFRTVEKLAPQPRTVEVILCAAMVKFDHFEWMIEKATELGVAEIVPVEAVRTERGLEKAAHKRLERWRRIALEASQQARRAFLPVVAEPASLKEILAREFSHRLVLDECGGKPLAGALPLDRRQVDYVAVLVGPEGGWTEEERAEFVESGWVQITLGPLILRAETAALAALAVIQAEWLTVPDTLEH
jgi:16S rRNA (uracil1498-N3)-methyltransferase